MDSEKNILDYQKQRVKAPAPMSPPSIEGAQKSINLDPAYYRKILEEQKKAGANHGMEIGGPNRLARLWRLLIVSVALLIVAGAFSFLFYYFTNNLRIALIIVTAMLVYMVLSAYLAEGTLDDHRRT